MAAEGMQFSRRWNGGTICTNLNFIWGMSDKTVRRWFLKFGSTIAANLRHTRLRVPNSRALDRRLAQTAWRAQAV